MYNLIRADLFKISKSKAIKILLSIMILSAVVMTVMAYMIPQGKIDTGMTGIGFMFSDTNMISILGAVIAGILICGDFDNKTIHDAISSGSSRGILIISKTIVFCLSIALLLLPYAIIIGIALGTGNEYSMGSVAVGFLHLLTTNAGEAISAIEIGKILAVMLTLMMVYMAQLSVCVPLAFVLRKPVLVVAINYGISILNAQLMGLRENSELFDQIISITPFGGNYTFLTMETEIDDIFKAISVSLIFIIVMLAITYRAFRKSEIK